MGRTGEGVKLRPPEAAPHRHGTVVLDHGSEPKGPAEAPDACVGQEMPMKIIHEEAVPGHPLHLRKHLDRRRAVEVVKEQGCVGEVDCPSVVGKGPGIPDLDTDAGPEGGRELSIKIGPGMTNRDGVGVDADEVYGTPEAFAPPGQVEQMVAAPTPYIQQAEAIMSLQNRVEDMIRCPVPSEQPVDASEVAEGPCKTGVRDRKVVHPLLGLQTRREVRAGRKDHREGMGGCRKDTRTRPRRDELRDLHLRLDALFVEAVADLRGEVLFDRARNELGHQPGEVPLLPRRVRGVLDGNL